MRTLRIEIIRFMTRSYGRMKMAVPMTVYDAVEDPATSSWQIKVLNRERYAPNQPDFQIAADEFDRRVSDHTFRIAD